MLIDLLAQYWDTIRGFKIETTIALDGQSLICPHCEDAMVVDALGIFSSWQHCENPDCPYLKTLNIACDKCGSLAALRSRPKCPMCGDHLPNHSAETYFCVDCAQRELATMNSDTEITSITDDGADFIRTRITQQGMVI